MNDPIIYNEESNKIISPHLALSISILAGELLMKNGAETYRVEDTMVRMMKSCGYDKTNSYATPTGIMASIDDDENHVSSVRRLNNRSNNFEVVSKVNHLSRCFAQGDFTPEMAYDKLKEISQMPPPYSIKAKAWWCGIACACFAWLMGGKPLDAANAFIVGLCVQIILSVTGFLPNILQSLLGGFSIAFLAQLLIYLGLGTNVEYIVIGSLMPLLPGIAFINAIRDFMAGDYISGSSRMSDVILLAICLATGIAMTLSLGEKLLGGL